MTGDAARPLPVLLDMQGRRAVVLGSGSQAESAIERLRAAGATILHLTSGAAPGPESDGRDALTTRERGYVRGDLAGADVALCYEADPDTQGGFSAEARAEGCLVFVAGAPGLSTFKLVE